jgi:hypothetical protein
LGEEPGKKLDHAAVFERRLSGSAAGGHEA